MQFQQSTTACHENGEEIYEYQLYIDIWNGYMFCKTKVKKNTCKRAQNGVVLKLILPITCTVACPKLCLQYEVTYDMLNKQQHKYAFGNSCFPHKNIKLS